VLNFGFKGKKTPEAPKPPKDDKKQTVAKNGGK